MRQTSFVLVLLALAGIAVGGWLGNGSPAAPRVQVQSEGSSATVLDITLTGVETQQKIEAGQTYTALSLPGQPAMTGIIGAPALPQIVSNLGLPDNARVTVEVLEAEYQTYAGVLVYPAQRPLTDHDEPEFTIDPAAYAKDVQYPAELARVSLQSQWRELPFATIEISPVTYNAAKQELRVYTHLRVRVNHPGTPVRRVIEPWLAGIYSSHIDNFDQLPVDVRWNDNPGVRYLVIAHSAYQNSWLDSLVAWHYKRGVRTRVIYGSNWTDVAIRESVKAEYNRNNPPVLRWVLLVGEYNQIPQHNYPAVGGADIWYVDVVPPASPDNYFDVGLGRFSVTDTADLRKQILKTLKFQKDPPMTPDWFSRVSLVAHSEQYPLKYAACSRGIFNFPYPLYRYNFDTIFGGANGTNAMVTSAINEGRVVVNYRGHGDETSWTGWDRNGASWGAAQVNALTNGDMTPVVINCCCLNHVLSTPSCMGETWMRKYPGGAVASVGASEASYTIPNHGWDSLLFRCLGDTYQNNVPGVRLYSCPTYDLGWMLNNADAYIQRYYSSQGGTDNAQMYYWLGDPALSVWTGAPAAPTVDYVPIAPLGQFDMTLTVTRQGTPVKDALVCLWKPGEFYVTGYTNAAGTVTLAINALTPGEFHVTVTGQKILPFEGTCLAQTSGTAYVTYLRHTIDDVGGGNGDGSVNPGETINLPLWVKNHGDSNAVGLVGTLRISDPFVTLTDSTHNFGTVLARDSAWTGADGYEFTVAPACTNGHMIQFQLVCRDANDSTWTSRVMIRVGAPNLAYVGYAVDDNVPGGNRNGRIDPSESAELMVTLRNTGFGHAANVTAVLRSGDSRLLVDDSLGTYGLIMAESTGTNSADRFAVTTLAMAPETPISCTLIVTCGALVQRMPFTIMVGEIRPVDPIPDGPRTPALYWAYENTDTMYSEAPQYNWVEIAGLGTRLTLSDDQTVTINLPAGFGPFRFYGQNYTTLSICSNGWVGLGSTTVSTYTNTALPNTSLPPAFFLHWDDMYPPYGGGVWWYHDAANHRFIVEYDSVPFYRAQSNYQKFQIILYDTTLAAWDGNCEAVMQYQIITDPSSCTVGEQAVPTTGVYIQCLFDNNYHRGSSALTANRAIKFTTDPPFVGVKEAAASGVRLNRGLALAVAPNPFRTSAGVNWQVPVPGRVRLVVFDVSGRAVRTLVSGQVEAGSYTVQWDGRDDAGQLVANGTYLYRLETDAGRVTTRAVMLR